MKKKIGYFIALLSVILPLIYEYNTPGTFIFERFITLFIAILFISINFILDYKKVWNFCYKKRWFICIGILLYVLIMGFNTSSVNCYNSYIQPNIIGGQYIPIFNEPQGVRSDEWATSTPLKLSQYKLDNPFSKENDLLMGNSSLVNLHPIFASFSFSTLTSPRLWGYLVFDEARAVTVDTMFEWILLFFVSFDFFLIITDKKKILSLFGAIFVTFAPAVVWWNSYCFALFGESIVIAVYHFLKSEKTWKKILLSILIGWLGACLVMTMYPAWLVPYFYIFAGIVIWLLIKNWKKENTKITLLGITIAVLMAFGLIIPTFIQNLEVFELLSNTVYPGARFATGNDGTEYTLFNYIGSLFYWYKPLPNPCEASQFVGLFPIPIIMVIYYTIKKIIKKEKVDTLSIILGIIAIVFTINVYFSLPWLARITLLYLTPASRLTVVINYLCIIILMRNMSISATENIRKNETIIATTLGVIMTYIATSAFTGHYADYIPTQLFYPICIFFTIIFILSILNSKKTNYIFGGILATVTLVSGMNVPPISIGIDVLYEKPISKEIQSIVKEDENSTWITVATSHVVSNYLVANGASTITSTNFYPNYDIWKKLENYKEYDDVINRYAHFITHITEEDTYFELMQSDLVHLFINPEDIETLGIDYIVSTYDLSKHNNEQIKFENIYMEDGMYIFSANY